MHQHPHIKSSHTENWIQKKLCGRVTLAVRIKSRSCLKTESHRANPGSVVPDRHPGSAPAAPGLGRVPPRRGSAAAVTRARRQGPAPAPAPGKGTAPALGTALGTTSAPGTALGTAPAPSTAPRLCRGTPNPPLWED